MQPSAFDDEEEDGDDASALQWFRTEQFESKQKKLFVKSLFGTDTVVPDKFVRAASPASVEIITNLPGIVFDNIMKRGLNALAIVLVCKAWARGSFNRLTITGLIECSNRVS